MVKAKDYSLGKEIYFSDFTSPNLVPSLFVYLFIRSMVIERIVLKILFAHRLLITRFRTQPNERVEAGWWKTY